MFNLNQHANRLEISQFYRQLYRQSALKLPSGYGPLYSISSKEKPFIQLCNS